MTYCACGSKCPGYVSLRDEHNTFVCGRCFLPSYLVWWHSECFCDECGGIIHTRWEKVCRPCQTAMLESLGDPPHDPDMVAAFGVQPDWWHPDWWVGWQTAAKVSRVTWPYRWDSQNGQVRNALEGAPRADSFVSG